MISRVDQTTALEFVPLAHIYLKRLTWKLTGVGKEWFLDPGCGLGRPLRQERGTTLETPYVHICRTFVNGRNKALKGVLLWVLVRS